MNQNIALIKNPVSRLNWVEDRAFTEYARQWLGDRFSMPGSVSEITEVVGRFAKMGVDCIIIDGGDGTISKVMTAIGRVYPCDKVPRLIILPSGNTNLIAKDVGFGLRGLEALKRIRKKGEQQRLMNSVQYRYALRIEWTDASRAPVLGMFQGAVAFARAIQIAHSPAILKNFPHDWAVVVTMVSALLKLVFPWTRDLWLKGEPCVFTVGNRLGYQENCFLFLATTLQSLSHGIWPFFDRYSDKATLHYLNVKAYPSRLLAACVALLRGKIPAWLRQDPHYLSGQAEKIVMELKGNIILDGESFDTGKDHRIHLSIGPQFAFVRL